MKYFKVVGTMEINGTFLHPFFKQDVIKIRLSYLYKDIPQFQ
jgi:hypothetical protein